MLFLQAAEQRTQRVGTLPADADCPPAAATSRRKAGPLLKLSVIGHGRNDSKAVSSSRDGGGGGGDGRGVTSSSSPADPIEAGGKSGSAGGKASAKTVTKDKAKQAASAKTSELSLIHI